MTIMVDWAFVEGIFAGLGWGLLVGGVLGMRYLERMVVEANDDAGGSGEE